MDDVQLMKENTSNECEDSRLKRKAAKQIQSPLEEGQVNSVFRLPRVCSGWLKLIMVVNRLLRILFTLLVYTVSFSQFVSAENKKSPAVLAVEKVGGVVLPTSGGGWEVAFHLRGRDLLSDEGLKTLKGLGDVMSLNLRDTKITSSGLAHLKGLSSLRRLHLERTEVADSGLQHLSGLKELEYLNLYQTQVSDKGLEHLTGLKKLKKIYLWKTKVSDIGFEKLQNALPQLMISRGLDLKKLAAEAPKPPSPKPRVPMKWLPYGGSESPPTKSVPGSPVQVTFLNKAKNPVKLVWIDYGGGQKLYGEISAGGKRDQNTYSKAVWLITDLSDKPLGHFVTTKEDSNGVIPGS